MKNSNSVQILRKGLLIFYENENYFVSYDGIILITPIKVILNPEEYYLNIGKYFGNTIQKMCCFTIRTKLKDFDIFIEKDFKEFPSLNDKEGLSKQAIDWIKEDNMKDEFNRLNEIRNKIIEKINED